MNNYNVSQMDLSYLYNKSKITVENGQNAKYSMWSIKWN